MARDGMDERMEWFGMDGREDESPADDTADVVDVVRVLEEARRRGLVGSGSLDRLVEHARGFATTVAGSPEMCLDLGSGGGLPGLVLARLWPATRFVLLDGSARRAAFLSWAVAELGFDGSRVAVRAERAETAGRSEVLRSAVDLVVARSFGPPAVVAECAAPFLCVGGRLVVSEPPPSTASTGGEVVDRWDRGGLSVLGMVPERRVTRPFGYQVMLQEQPCPDRFPRRVGIPAKRPLFA